MARKRTPQIRGVGNIARQAVSEYGTQKRAAEALGVSVSTLRSALGKTGSRVRESTFARMEESFSTDDNRFIEVGEAAQMLEYYESMPLLSKGQRRAKKALEKMLDDAEEEGLESGDMIERKEITSGTVTYRGGRSKDYYRRRAWKKKMRKQGYTGDLDGLYDEMTGYTRM